jgi:large subunit ribosomal protein L25
MKINVIPRDGMKKSDTKNIRRRGDIPAVFYSQGEPTETIVVKGSDLETALRTMPEGRLPTTVFTFSLGGKERKAVVKDIQYHRTTYRVLHVDFVELKPNIAVDVKVPINCINANDCLGIKLGGFLRQVIRHVKVRCADPFKIPEEFLLDVKDLALFQSHRLADLAVPEGVKVLAPLNEVAVIIAKR